MVEFVGYRDITPLGEGGLGRVYKATRVSTGGTVAIKELRDVESASDVTHRARRELNALLKLKGHPYVVSVEEIIEGPAGPCLVMEYAPGGSLHDRVQLGPLSGPEVVLAGQHVVSALGAAHEVGIIHRDVKPHNLLIGAFGQVKVCDFGIAAIVMGPSGRTQTQAFTLAYASPEELDGDVEVGPPADVYSFAATWVHLMTGRRPTFKDRLSGSALDISVPTGAVEPSLRPLLIAIRAGLAHQPQDRPTMDDLRVVLDEVSLALGARRLRRLMPDVPSPELDSSDAIDAAPTVFREDSERGSGPEEPTVVDDVALTVKRSTRSSSDAGDSPLLVRRSRVKWFVVAGVLLVAVAAVAARSLDRGDSSVASTAEPTSVATATTARTTSSTAPSMSRTDIAGLADAYRAAASSLEQRYAELDALFPVGSTPTEDLPKWCAAARDAELGYWDVLLKSEGPTPELAAALANEAQAEADLISSLDSCANSGPDPAAIEEAYEVSATMNSIAWDAMLKTRALLGVPPP